MSSKRIRRRAAAIATVALGFGVAGQASAENYYPDAFQREVAKHEVQVLAPDDNVGLRRGGMTVQTPYPDVFQRELAKRTAQPAPIQASVPRSSEGFDWAAAGVGASTSTALLFTVAILIGITRRSRTRSAPA
jgi:hypothetical protein